MEVFVILKTKILLKMFSNVYIRAAVLFRYINHMSPNPYHMISGGDVWDTPNIIND